MIFKRKLRKNMKKKMIISTCFALALLIGFLLGKCNSYVMNTSINGSYTEKELQSEKGPFQLELMDNTYQYYDPGTNENGEGSYEKSKSKEYNSVGVDCTGLGNGFRGTKCWYELHWTIYIQLYSFNDGRYCVDSLYYVF